MLKCLRKILEMRGSAGFACDNKGFNVRRWNNNNNGIYIALIHRCSKRLGTLRNRNEKNGQQNMLIIRDDS